MTEMQFKKKMDKLPEELKKEVEDFIDFLVEKRGKSPKTRGWNFDWEGALADLKDQYTSVELQHKASEWR
jgi:hypothetical protein